MRSCLQIELFWHALFLQLHGLLVARNSQGSLLRLKGLLDKNKVSLSSAASVSPWTLRQSENPIISESVCQYAPSTCPHLISDHLAMIGYTPLCGDGGHMSPCDGALRVTSTAVVPFLPQPPFRSVGYLVKNPILPAH